MRHPIIFCVITADEALAELTLHAFEKCDVDGVYGISWKEVMECEEEFCEKLNILCPTQQEFQSFDQNEDGILTLEEYFDQMWLFWVMSCLWKLKDLKLDEKGWTGICEINKWLIYI